MKKVLLMCFMLIIAFTMAGCSNESEKEKDDRELLDMEMEDNQNNNSNNSDTNALDEVVIKNIKQNYIKVFLNKYNNVCEDEVHIDKTYGVYNNAYVLKITNDYYEYLCVITYEVASNKVFTYPDNNHLLVYYNNSFYGLSEAYLENILLDDDINAIYDEFTK